MHSLSWHAINVKMFIVTVYNYSFVISMTEASAPACGAFINNSVRVKIFSWCVRGRRGERPPPPHFHHPDMLYLVVRMQ